MADPDLQDSAECPEDEDEEEDVDPLLEVPLRRCTLCCLASQLAVGILVALTLAVLLPVAAIGLALTGAAACGADLPRLANSTGSGSAGAGDEEEAVCIWSTLLYAALALPLSCALCLCQVHARRAPRKPQPGDTALATLLDDRLQVFYKPPGSAAKLVGPVPLGELARLVARRQTDKVPSSSRVWAVADEVASAAEKQNPEESALLDQSIDVEAAPAFVPAAGRAGEDPRVAGLVTACVHEIVDARALPPRPCWPIQGPTPDQVAAAAPVGARLLFKLFPTTVVSQPVVLQVYDWSGTAEPMLAKANSWLGHFIGVYHTGLAIGVDEWCVFTYKNDDFSTDNDDYSLEK